MASLHGHAKCNIRLNNTQPTSLFQAIVFGPGIIRKCNDSLETVVKDMRHQCQIVESLINNVSRCSQHTQ